MEDVDDGDDVEAREDVADRVDRDDGDDVETGEDVAD